MFWHELHKRKYYKCKLQNGISLTDGLRVLLEEYANQNELETKETLRKKIPRKL
jgi:hypothetical protein